MTTTSNKCNQKTEGQQGKPSSFGADPNALTCCKVHNCRDVPLYLLCYLFCSWRTSEDTSSHAATCQGLQLARVELGMTKGNRSHLMVMFSVEVNDGLLSTTLPVHLIKTAELKIKSSNQWQPLQTFVTIANQFIMKGRGLRFQGTIGDCNNAMQQLFFQGSNLDALLTITVNDLGNYGCYLDCTDIMSFPRSIEASVILIKRRPLNSTTAFLLGSAIFFEIATVFLLGGLLLFFICKCMIALHTGREDSDNSKNNPREELLGNHKEKNALNFSGISTPGSLQRGHSLSTPVSLSRRHSNFRQRSRQRIKLEESELPPSYASFGDNLQLNPPYIEMQKQHQSD